VQLNSLPLGSIIEPKSLFSQIGLSGYVKNSFLSAVNLAYGVNFEPLGFIFLTVKPIKKAVDGNPPTA
jgi:hypothetical protein